MSPRARTLVDRLCTAVARGNVQRCAYLLKHTTVDVNGDDTGALTPLGFAIMSRHLVIAQMLIYHGADVNKRVAVSSTPLIYATSLSMMGIDMMRLLLENGADVNVAANGQQALHVAAECELMDAMRLLLEYGADIHAVDKWGNTVLQYVRMWKM